jgi:hypothetical protein
MILESDFDHSEFKKKFKSSHLNFVLISSTVCVHKQTIVANIVSSKLYPRNLLVVFNFFFFLLTETFIDKQKHLHKKIFLNRRKGWGSWRKLDKKPHCGKKSSMFYTSLLVRWWQWLLFSGSKKLARFFNFPCTIITFVFKIVIFDHFFVDLQPIRPKFERWYVRHIELLIFQKWRFDRWSLIPKRRKTPFSAHSTRLRAPETKIETNWTKALKFRDFPRFSQNLNFFRWKS